MSKPSSNQMSQIMTQAVQTIHAKINLARVRLKKGAKVPELLVYEEAATSAKTYPLLGDRYLLGRNQNQCDIVVSNSVVSQVHLSLRRDPQNKRSFLLRDQNSTNGTFRGSKRIRYTSLYHGQVVTIGPPQLATSVRIKYRYPRPWWINGLRYLLMGLLGVIFFTCLLLVWAWSRVDVYPLPTEGSGPIVVYAEDGTPLTPARQNTHQELRQLSNFSPYLPQAVIASEDTRFYWHLGVDPIGIVRAVVINLGQQEIRQGASTLTQQLARSLFPQVGRENTAERKLREMVVALKLEAIYSKDEILKTYLNRVYLGQNNFGFEDAAQFYFDRSARDLTIAEAATLVAILPAPNSYNPVQDYDTAISLRNRVIERMANLGMISESEASRARRSRIEVSPTAQDALSQTIAPYFYSYVMEEMTRILGTDVAREGNFIVETSLDVALQEQAEATVAESWADSENRFGFAQGALVTLNSSNGEILAMVGGKDYTQSQFNRVTQAQRQPGSTFKVFAYGAALEQGISPDKIYSCDPVTWQGQNYRACERSEGDIDMYRALAMSENAVALRVAQDVGLDSVIEFAQRLGIKSPLTKAPGLVLGQSEVNLLEITGAYGAIANQGKWHLPHAIRRILDGNDCVDTSQVESCRQIYSFADQPNTETQAISGAIARQLTFMMQQVVTEGTGKAAYVGRGEAGKTGTTDRNVDLWYIGYLPDANLVTGIWLGNDDNSSTWGSSSQAAAIWGLYHGG